MGMFDSFVIEDYSIHPELEKVKPTEEELVIMKKMPDYGLWQTKSLDCMLDTYKLNKYGNITKFEANYDWSGEEKANSPITYPFPYHGTIELHDSRDLEYFSKDELPSDFIGRKVKRYRWISVELVFNAGNLSDVLILTDKITEMDPPQSFSLKRHIKEHVEAGPIPLKRRNKHFIAGFVVEKGENDKWAVYDHRQTICVNSLDGGVIPYVAEEGPLYFFVDEYEASRCLQKFVKRVQSGDFDDEEYF